MSIVRRILFDASTQFSKDGKGVKVLGINAKRTKLSVRVTSGLAQFGAVGLTSRRLTAPQV